MNATYDNDINILILSGIFVFISILLLNTGKSTCISKYIAYGIFLLPGTYLLVSLMGIGSFFPKGLGYIFLIFGIFYLPYLVALVLPSVIVNELGIKLFIANNFTEYSKPIEFTVYIIIWIILFSVMGYLLCAKK